MTRTAKAAHVERNSERRAMSVPVEFQTSDGMIMATTANMSRSGMFIQTPTPLPMGSKAFFKLRLPPNALHFHLEGEVVWSYGRRRGRPIMPRGMGIRFLESRAQSEKTVESIISVLNAIESRA